MRVWGGEGWLYVVRLSWTRAWGHVECDLENSDIPPKTKRTKVINNVFTASKVKMTLYIIHL